MLSPKPCPKPCSRQARAALGERSRQLAALDVNALALPPGGGGGRQAQQLAAWDAYLAWERSNYQRLEHAAYTSRVVRRGREGLGSKAQGVQQLPAPVACGLRL